MKTIAISIGDLNGIGIQLALENHETIKKVINPLYCIDEVMLKQASELLKIPIPSDFKIVNKIAKKFTIEPSKVTKEAGVYSFASFLKAVELSKLMEVDGIMTLPIHKKAWELAGVSFKGHTDALREFFFAPAIMMLGSPKMYVALYTEHVPLHQVAKEVKDVQKLSQFLIDFYENIKDGILLKSEKIGLLGLNPHAGDDGVLGEAN